jgi:hypothetical protein
MPLPTTAKWLVFEVAHSYFSSSYTKIIAPSLDAAEQFLTLLFDKFYECDVGSDGTYRGDNPNYNLIDDISGTPVLVSISSRAYLIIGCEVNKTDYDKYRSNLVNDLKRTKPTQTKVNTYCFITY